LLNAYIVKQAQRRRFRASDNGPVPLRHTEWRRMATVRYRLSGLTAAIVERIRPCTTGREGLEGLGYDFQLTGELPATDIAVWGMQ
jgi:hypothetical protein